MKFNMPEKQETIPVPPELKVGNVYASKQTRKTACWVCIGIEGQSVYLVGLDSNGRMTGVQNYGRHVLEGQSGIFKPRPIIGFVNGLDDLSFDVELFGEDGL